MMRFSRQRPAGPQEPLAWRGACRREERAACGPRAGRRTCWRACVAIVVGRGQDSSARAWRRGRKTLRRDLPFPFVCASWYTTVPCESARGAARRRHERARRGQGTPRAPRGAPGGLPRARRARPAAGGRAGGASAADGLCNTEALCVRERGGTGGGGAFCHTCLDHGGRRVRALPRGPPWAWAGPRLPAACMPNTVGTDPSVLLLLHVLPPCRDMPWESQAIACGACCASCAAVRAREALAAPRAAARILPCSPVSTAWPSDSFLPACTSAHLLCSFLTGRRSAARRVP